jgi:hypothetical protein
MQEPKAREVMRCSVEEELAKVLGCRAPASQVVEKVEERTAKESRT